MANKVKGYTLVEMLVVIVIIGILISMATIGINAFLRNSKLNEYRDGFLSMVEEARTRSIVSVPHAIEFVNGSNYRLVRLNDVNNNFIVDGSEGNTVIESASLKSDYTISWNRDTSGADPCTDASDSLLWFDRKGIPRCNNWGLGMSTITFTSKSMTKQIVIDRAGKIKYE